MAGYITSIAKYLFCDYNYFHHLFYITFPVEFQDAKKTQKSCVQKYVYALLSTTVYNLKSVKKMLK